MDLENNTTSQDHEKLFDEICGKLQELSLRSEATAPDRSQDRLDKMQNQLRRSHQELKQAQQDIQDKIKSLESLSFTNFDTQSSTQNQRLAEQLDGERQNNSKLSSDLAKSLELNLKLQFEIEEIRAKSNQILGEEKKHNAFLTDKNKGLSHEADLAHALTTEMRLELNKAKENYHLESQSWQKEKIELIAKAQEHVLAVDERDSDIQHLKNELASKVSEIESISNSLTEFQDYSDQQQNLVQNLTAVAEKKLIELKIALDRKSAECQDYNSHLQQALTQINIFKQENVALKDYISKLAALHNQARPQEGHA